MSGPDGAGLPTQVLIFWRAVGAIPEELSGRRLVELGVRQVGGFFSGGSGRGTVSSDVLSVI